MCIQCHSKNIAYTFPVIEIQTLHIRDISGEKYVQAMGEKSTHSVCSSCANHYLEELKYPESYFVKKWIPFAVLIILGLIATFFIKTDIIFMRLLGPIAVLFGILSIASSYKELTTQKNQFTSLSSEEALKKSAWLLLLKQLPKKNSDNDLTYIPVNQETKSMDIKDLVATYDLLPAIAKQVKQAC